MKLLVKTLEKKEDAKVPIWIMRQAGRYLPEYRVLRKNFNSFMEFCLDSDAASEATLQPIRRFNLDAAIIFADILVIPKALGMKVDFIDGLGPHLSGLTSLNQLSFDQKVLEQVFLTVQKTRAVLNRDFPDKTLIGFAGAPWTVACYMIEGKGSKDFAEVRKFYYRNKESFLAIISTLVEVTSEYLIGQIKAGAEVIKIFDSWAGLVPPRLFEELVIEPTKKIVSRVKNEYNHIPIIGFPRGAGLMYLDYASRVGLDCVAVDQNVDLLWAKNNLQQCNTIQGNLDNALLFSSKHDIEDGARSVLDCFSHKPFVFNLGHGVLPETPIENMEYLIDFVKSYEKSNIRRDSTTA